MVLAQSLYFDLKRSKERVFSPPSSLKTSSTRRGQGCRACFLLTGRLGPTSVPAPSQLPLPLPDPSRPFQTLLPAPSPGPCSFHPPACSEKADSVGWVFGGGFVFANDASWFLRLPGSLFTTVLMGKGVSPCGWESRWLHEANRPGCRSGQHTLSSPAIASRGVLSCPGDRSLYSVAWPPGFHTHVRNEPRTMAFPA